MGENYKKRLENTLKYLRKKKRVLIISTSNRWTEEKEDQILNINDPYILQKVFGYLFLSVLLYITIKMYLNVNSLCIALYAAITFFGKEL